MSGTVRAVQEDVRRDEKKDVVRLPIPFGKSAYNGGGGRGASSDGLKKHLTVGDAELLDLIGKTRIDLARTRIFIEIED